MRSLRSKFSSSSFLERPTDNDSIEIAVGFTHEVGAFLSENSPRANATIFERFRAVSNECSIMISFLPYADPLSLYPAHFLPPSRTYILSLSSFCRCCIIHAKREVPHARRHKQLLCPCTLRRCITRVPWITGTNGAHSLSSLPAPHRACQTRGPSCQTAQAALMVMYPVLPHLWSPLDAFSIIANHFWPFWTVNTHLHPLSNTTAHSQWLLCVQDS